MTHGLHPDVDELAVDGDSGQLDAGDRLLLLVHCGRRRLHPRHLPLRLLRQGHLVLG